MFQGEIKITALGLHHLLMYLMLIELTIFLNIMNNCVFEDIEQNDTVNSGMTSAVAVVGINLIASLK